MVKNLHAKAGDLSLTPGSGRPLKKEMAAYSNILLWEISWTEELGRLKEPVTVTKTTRDIN